jgi:hypothetical protein
MASKRTELTNLFTDAVEYARQIHTGVLVQPEKEKRRIPLVKIPSFWDGDFSGIGVRQPGYPSAWLHPCSARFRFTW